MATRNSLLFLLAFLGIGALGGGAIFIISPDGELMTMPLSMLQNSPFTNFLVPGMVLFSVLGCVPILLILALIKKPVWKFAEKLNAFNDMHWAWTYCIYCAFFLISWLQIQMMFIEAVHWLHTFYMFYSIVLIFVSLLPGVRRLYRK